MIRFDQFADGGDYGVTPLVEVGKTAAAFGIHQAENRNGKSSAE